MDVDYFKESIREDYKSTIKEEEYKLEDIQNTNLRHFLESLIRFKNSFPRHNLINFDIEDT